MKKIIPALCLMLVAAMLLGTSTYAWFSMNATVKAQGMQVNVKSNNVTLLIGTENSLTTVQAANSTVATFTTTTDESKVFPSAYFKTGDTTPTGSAAVVGKDSAAVPANWYYKIADRADASVSSKAPEVLTSFDNYVIKYDLYVTMAKGSNPSANLKVSGATFAYPTPTGPDSRTMQAVRVLVVSDSAMVELSPATLSSETVLATTVTDQALVKLSVYIYYDGNDSTVFTNNIANLAGAIVELNFTVSIPEAPVIGG